MCSPGFLWEKNLDGRNWEYTVSDVDVINTSSIPDVEKIHVPGETGERDNRWNICQRKEMRKLIKIRP